MSCFCFAATVARSLCQKNTVNTKGLVHAMISAQLTGTGMQYLTKIEERDGLMHFEVYEESSKDSRLLVLLTSAPAAAGVVATILRDLADRYFGA